MVKIAEKQIYIDGGREELCYGINMFFYSIEDNTNVMIIGSIFAGLFICGDFENKIIQQSIASGCSRLKVLLSKALVYFVGVHIIILTYVIITTAITSYIYEFGIEFTLPVFIKMLNIIICVLIINSSVLSFYVLLSFLLRNSSMIIGIGMGICFLTICLKSLMETGKAYNPLWSIILYTPFKLNEFVLSINLQGEYIVKVVIISMVYIVMFIGISYKLFKRSDLK